MPPLFFGGQRGRGQPAQRHRQAAGLRLRRGRRRWDQDDFSAIHPHEQRLADRVAERPDHRDLAPDRLERVTNRTIAQLAAPDGVHPFRQPRLLVHDPRRQDDPLRLDHAARVRGQQWPAMPFQRTDEAADDGNPEPDHLLFHPCEQFAAGNAVGKSGQIMAAGNQGGARGTAVDHRDVATETRQIDRSHQAGRPAADDQHLSMHMTFAWGSQDAGCARRRPR